MEARMCPDIVYAGGSGSPGRQANPYLAPSMDTGGRGLIDMRVGYNQTRKGAIAIGMGFYRTLRQAPAAKATANIAALANVVTNTPMTLVNASGAGITYIAATVQIWGSGTIIPVAALAIDGAPTLVNFGNANPAGLFPLSWYDWTTASARCVSITGVVNGTGGNFIVAGYDLYGYPQTEQIAAGAGVSTVNGAKGWKFVTSVTPKFTDAHNYSVGTADIFEFPARADNFEDVLVYWNSALITANTGFTAADTTDPATKTTGSTRGTYAVQSAADGTKVLSFAQSPGLARSVTAKGFWGVTPA